MPLRTRLLLYVGLTCIGLVAGIYVISSSLLHYHYAALEQQYTSLALERAGHTSERRAGDRPGDSSSAAKTNGAGRFPADQGSTPRGSHRPDRAQSSGSHRPDRAQTERRIGRIVRDLTGLIALATAIFGFVILAVLERSVLARLSTLAAQVDRIDDGPQALAQIQLAGNDELGRLAMKINAVLGALNEKTRRLEGNEERLTAYSENLEALVRAHTAEVEAKSAILEHAVDGISELDTDGHYISANAAYAAMLGCTPESLVGRRWDEHVYAPDQERLRSAYQAMVRDGKAEEEARGIHENGTLFHMEVVLIAAYDENGDVSGHYRFMKDVSERKHLEVRIEHQAFHDHLTGLPNRTLFMDRLEMALARTARHPSRVGVVFLDLDNFKIVNDSLGHDAGDALLLEIAARLGACVRPEDTVARLGGDEFTILLQDLGDAEQAMSIAERVVDSLRAPLALPQGEVFVSGSIGVAFATEGTTPEALLRNADTAMYHAKANGKAGYALFDQSMSDRVVERLELETGLRRALEKGEFRVWYQPLVDLESGRMHGVEALVRWEHPSRGMVQPNKFIPIAEETGLIAPLGYWVLEEACRQGNAWSAEYPSSTPLLISVNLSGRQLQRADVIERVSEILNRTGFPAENLQLEITESVLMYDTADTIAKLEELRSLGVRLAIDDFGTGYSSMSVLSQFPIHTVKIDRAFISRLGDEDEATAIVAAIVMLSRTMGLNVTAEGVETEDQIMQLQALNCKTGQGYYFAKPQVSEALRSYLQIAPHAFARPAAKAPSAIQEMLARMRAEENAAAA